MLIYVKGPLTTTNEGRRIYPKTWHRLIKVISIDSGIKLSCPIGPHSIGSCHNNGRWAYGYVNCCSFQDWDLSQSIILDLQ